MGAFDTHNPAHHRAVHKLRTADPEDTGSTRDCAINLCWYVQYQS